jgi:GntR family transcriptional regulator
MTIRQAVDGLVSEGLVMRRHGSGTYVLHHPQAQRALNRLIGFTEDMQAQGRRVTSKELKRSEVDPPRHIHEELELEDAAHAIVLERLRLIDGEPVALHRVWLPFSLAPELARRPLRGGSLYAILEHELGIRLTTARQRITAVAASEREARLLGVGPGDPLIFTERLTRDANNVPVEFAEGWSAPKLALWVELHR